MASTDPGRALSFGRFAAPGASHVADVGAGTGKLTGQLLERRLDVEAVEPDAGMLDVLRRVFPGAQAHQAAVDALPLDDASVDAVLVADEWLGLEWNIPILKEPWEFELAGIDPDRKGLEGSDTYGAEKRLPFPPTETETARFPWIWELTPDRWRSYLAAPLRHEAFCVRWRPS